MLTETRFYNALLILFLDITDRFKIGLLFESSSLSRAVFEEESDSG